MGKFYYDKKGYPRWRDSDELVHKTIVGKIEEGKVVHHNDGDKGNFRRDNLVVMDRGEHSSLEAKKRKSRW